MKLNYDMSDDDENLPDLNLSDLDDASPVGEERTNTYQKNSQPDNWILKKQNKSDQNDLLSQNYQIPKDSLEDDDFDQQYRIEDLIHRDQANQQNIQNKRFVPPSIENYHSNINLKGPKIYKGEGKFNKDSKPAMTPSLQIDLKRGDILSRQHCFQTEGHSVYFPFTPYQCQKDFMGKVIKALNQNENALLESPTGTGKTLSLLCASLAWLTQQRERAMIDKSNPDIPRIIYTSRTHSQLAQVQRELRNTAYNPKSIIIGSRDHLCVHPEIKLLRGNALNVACKKAQKSLDPCAYGKNREQALKTLKWEPYDIEELHNMAVSQIFCPYFASRDRVNGADIIFMPYNYLIDEKIRENFDVNYKGSVIIFDEAHNASSTAEDVASFEIVEKVLEQSIIELQKLEDEKRIQEDTINFKSNDEEIANLLQMTKQFQRYLDNFDMDQSKVKNFRIDQSYLKEGSVVMPGREIFEIFTKGTSIDYLDRVNQEQKSSNIFAGWDKFQTAFDNVLNDIATLQQYQVRNSLEVWYDILKKLIRLRFKKKPVGKSTDMHLIQEKPVESVNQDIDDFYVYIFDEEEEGSNQLQFNAKKKKNSGIFVQKNYQRKLAFWCFNAGIGFREIQELMPRSIILTSGTLSPLNSFQAELQLQFNQRLENPHVISPEQVSINILSRGVRDSQFNFSFSNRDNENSLIDLGLTIANVASVTPGGMLVFFPSYRVLQRCEEIWNNNNVKSAIEKQKKLYIEPKDSSKYQSTMDAFYKAIFNKKQNEKTNGAILMGVCRGRISEGLDFSDNAARCVMVVGIPYPQMTDARVVLKKDYLDKRISQNRMTGSNPEFQSLSGKDWYSQQATRAVNQAIGRVIRHVQDYGSIILVDERYNWGNMRAAISKWLRDRLRPHNKFIELQGTLKSFFEEMGKRKFKAKVEQLAQIQLEIDVDQNQKKQSASSSQDEESKNGVLGFMNQIGQNKPSKNTAETNNRATAISKLFEKSKNATNKNQKRTLADINESSDEPQKIKMRFTKDEVKQTDKQNTVMIEQQPIIKKNPFGFIDDDNDDLLDILEKTDLRKQNTGPSQHLEQQNFGLGLGLQMRESKKRGNDQANSHHSLVTQIDSYSYKATKKINSTTVSRLEEKHIMQTQNQSNQSIMNSSFLNDSKMSNSEPARPKNTGIYSSSSSDTKDDSVKNKFNFLISGFKKFLTDQQLQQVIKVIPKLKNAQEMPNVFTQIKDSLFNGKKDLKVDKSYQDKMVLLESLGSFLSSDKQEQFKGLMAGIA